MDVKNSSQLTEERKPLKLAEVLESSKKQFIRTMQKDIEFLQAGQVKKAAPPAQLPVAEGLRREVEIKKRIEETQKRLAEERMRAETVRQKTEPVPPEPVLPKRELPLKKEVKPAIKGTRLKFVLIGIGSIVVIAGIGGFLYWWNYLRVIPPVAMYYQCQDLQCISIEGEGEDQCLTDEDCQPIEPVEPTLPESLIRVDETRTIELTIEQENLLLDDLKLMAVQEQATTTFKQILVKLVSQTEKRYADLDTLISALAISLPDNILSIVGTSDVEGGNYTLFFYNQSEGNRLGIVIDMAESPALVEDLKNWEGSIIADLKPILLRDEVPEAFTEEFQDNVYQEIVIRYLNFPNPDLSIDYAVVDNELVITTSRESMYATISALLAASPTEDTVINCGQVGPDNPDPTGVAKDCVEKRFKECKPTQYTATLDLGPLDGLVTYYYEIIGPKDNLCEVKSKFLANPNPDWIGKEMVCEYDYKTVKDFETAVQNMTNCQGPLYDLMTGK